MLQIPGFVEPKINLFWDSKSVWNIQKSNYYYGLLPDTIFTNSWQYDFEFDMI